MTDYLSNRFLVAMPTLEDPNFQRTVTLVCEHNEEGALGLVINRPSDLTFGDLLSHMGYEGFPLAYHELPVYNGGPVQPERGFIVHSRAGQWDSTLHLADDLHVTTSKDILDAIASGEDMGEILVVLGYAGWGEGQLDEEMIGNAWLSTPASTEIIFRTINDQRWDRAANMIGVDLRLISHQAGHA